MVLAASTFDRDGGFRDSKDLSRLPSSEGEEARREALELREGLAGFLTLAVFAIVGLNCGGDLNLYCEVIKIVNDRRGDLVLRLSRVLVWKRILPNHWNLFHCIGHYRSRIASMDLQAALLLYPDGLLRT